MTRIRTIAFDGDDTLWHNESILFEGEAKFHRLLERHIAPEALKEHLFQTEMRNLHLFGYGVVGFALSMIESAIDVSGGTVTADEVQVVVQFGKEMLQHPVELIEGARGALEELAEGYELILITKGELLHQETKVARSGLADLFSAIEIVSEKNAEVYEDILRRHDIPPHALLMVGNSMRSDIIPIVELGGRAIHIPYHVTWQHEVVHAHGLTSDTFWEVPSIAAVPPLVRQIDSP